MKRLKRTLAAVLVFVMALSVIPAVSGATIAELSPYPQWQTIDGVRTVPCTYYVWEQVYEQLGIMMPGWGNAIDWYGAAQKSGYPVGTVPRENSVAVWSVSGHGYGHVAFVTEVCGDEMYVNEAGRGDALDTNGVVVGQKVSVAVGEYWYGRTLIGFIYLDGNVENVFNYEAISEGDYYYLKNNSTGKYLAVDIGFDGVLMNVSVADFTSGKKIRLDIREVSEGYIMRPRGTSMVVNPDGSTVSGGMNVSLFPDVSHAAQWWGFDKVPGGFIIRNMNKQNSVLSVQGTNVITQDYMATPEQIWSLEKVSYKVSYDANGGTGAPDSQTKIHNESLTLSDVMPVRKGYTLLGWAADAMAMEADYQPGSVFTANEDITLYAVWEANFADISASSWQINAALYACHRGLMSGKGTDADGNIKFDPNNFITREEFVQVLYNAEDKPSVNNENKFPDVASGGWYQNAVLWANSQNIASGMGNGNFGVGKNITRQDLAMMLYKYAKLKDCSLDAEAGKIDRFADGSKVAGYAKEAMDWAVTNGVLSGKGAAGADISTFRLDPAGTATRAECAAMLKNFMTAFGL